MRHSWLQPRCAHRMSRRPCVRRCKGHPPRNNVFSLQAANEALKTTAAVDAEAASVAMRASADAAAVELEEQKRLLQVSLLFSFE